MIDIHSHILPQMDDGSQSPEETAALLKLLKAQGITDVVATPHFYADQETPESFLKRRQEAVARMLPPEEGQPNLLLGAEVAYFSGIGNCQDMQLLRIENTQLLLIEMPFYDWTDRIVEEICHIPINLRLIPVLAHVNRYRGAHQFPKYRRQLSDCGVYFQCNAEAFHGPLSRRWALHLLKQGQIHYLGSDCHNLNTRPPEIDLAHNVIEKKLGTVFYMRLENNIHAAIFPEEL